MKHVLCALSSALMVPFAGAAGSISGTVKGSDGSSVTAGVVTAYAGPSAQRFRRNSVAAAILPDGTFQLTPLAPGEYGICVEAPSTIWLGSCEWPQPLRASLHILPR